MTLASGSGGRVVSAPALSAVPQPLSKGIADTKALVWVAGVSYLAGPWRSVNRANQLVNLCPRVCASAGGRGFKRHQTKPAACRPLAHLRRNIVSAGTHCTKLSAIWVTGFGFITNPDSRWIVFRPSMPLIKCVGSSAHLLCDCRMRML